MNKSFELTPKMSLTAFNFTKKKKKENYQNLRLEERIDCNFQTGDVKEYCDICNMFLFLSNDWHKIFKKEFRKEYFMNLLKSLHSIEHIFPPVPKIFYFSHFFHINDTKVVIIGQDPYHNIGQATGLAFHVLTGIRHPPSLENIFKEVRGNYVSADCNLEKWANQGVLLLNDTLTVTKSSPNSHSKFGWTIFTDRILLYINSNCKNVVFLLWGQFAAKKRYLIDDTDHLILISSHPSPFSVRKGFEGCQHFLKTNEYLKSKKNTEIKW